MDSNAVTLPPVIIIIVPVVVLNNWRGKGPGTIYSQQKSMEIIFTVIQNHVNTLVNGEMTGLYVELIAIKDLCTHCSS